jgi:polyhydroxybutyrate depolymerase
MKNRLATGSTLLAWFCLLEIMVYAPTVASHAVRNSEHQLNIEGLARAYRLYVPENLPVGVAVPLVIVFHGGGGTASGVEKLTGFSATADWGKFIVAYPEGIGRHWNDGRTDTASRAHRERIDDVGFIAAMIDAIAAEHRIDQRRIYATGISNGAIFSHYLAARLARRITAIAPVVGGIAEPSDRRFDPAQPVSVLILQGTDDPLVPFDGGDIAWGRRGRIISTRDAVTKWVQRDGCAQAARAGSVPDTDPADGCRADWSTWSACRAGSEVTLYTLHGAGHTWPGGAQYLPQVLIGKVCRDIDATEIIWNFFRRHAKP